MRARHICTSFSEVRAPESNAAFRSAMVAESRSIVFGAAETSAMQSARSNSSRRRWIIPFRILVLLYRRQRTVRDFPHLDCREQQPPQLSRAKTAGNEADYTV